MLCVGILRILNGKFSAEHFFNEATLCVIILRSLLFG